MKLTHRLAAWVFAGSLGLMASGAASAKDTANIVLGAGLGALAGAVLSDGDTVATLGGAAAGGLLGHVLSDGDRGGSRQHWRGERHHAKPGWRDDRRGWRHDRHGDWRAAPPHRYAKGPGYRHGDRARPGRGGPQHGYWR